MSRRPAGDTARPPAPLAARWGGRGYVTDLGGPVHWIDFGGPSGGPGPAGRSAPPMVLVHGLGGSHLNWVAIAPALAAARRVLAVDLAGFGLTPAAGRSATVQSNARLLARFVRDIAGSPAVLVGNSMGGMISILHSRADPETVAGLVLVDPSRRCRGSGLTRGWPGPSRSTPCPAWASCT
jgi:pimeloyl-ACP methyl ester carboxylesterase